MNAFSYRALIVDSDAAWQSQVCCALTKEGFQCEVAADGLQAAEILASRPFDLLLTELVLPRLHGHSLIVQTLKHSQRPRIVVVSQLSDSRLVRDVLSRGADDYFHKSIPLELLATKLLSLFCLDDWRTHKVEVSSAPVDEPRDTRLKRIERQLQVVSDHFAERIAPLFEQDLYAAEVPSGIMDFAERMCIDERAAIEAQLHVSANTRKSERVDIRRTATVIQVNEQLMEVDAPMQVVLLDVSASGVRMIHTRAIPATDLVLAWQAETLPYYTIRLPLTVTRCRPVGRFYDIGGMFDIPPELELLS